MRSRSARSRAAAMADARRSSLARWGFAAALALAGCERAGTGARGDSAAALLPMSALEIDAYARHIDSLSYRGELRRIVRPRGRTDDPDLYARAYFLGEDLVMVRGAVGADTLPYVTYYLRGDRPVLVTQARDARGSYAAQPVSAARSYLNADTLIASSGRPAAANVAPLLAALRGLRESIAQPGRTVDAMTTDTLTARPMAPYVVRGACPFECCTYGGDWVIESGADLRAASSASAPVIGHVTPGTGVFADSGLVRVDTIGIVAVLAPLTTDDNIDFARGDTVLLLEPQGEGYSRAWVRGHALSLSQFWDSAGLTGARLVRTPAWRWWAHLVVAQQHDTLRGWVDMQVDSLRVSGNDACGN